MEVLRARPRPLCSSLCAAGKKLWPAAVLAFSVVLVVLFNICPSCNFGSVGLSLHPSSSASSMAPEFAPIPQPISSPELGQQDKAVYHLEEPRHTVASSQGKAENISQHEGITAPQEQHTGISEGHDSRKALRIEQDLLAAKQAIANAVVKANTELHAPLYHNLTMFIKSYELMEQILKIYTYKEGSPPLVHTGPTIGIYASEGRFIHQLQSSRQFLTSHPKKAHLFFMPYSVTNMVSTLYVRDSYNIQPLIRFITSYVQLIASKYPYWNITHGADHFFLSCHDWGPVTARKNLELRHNGIKVVCNADEKEEFVIGKDVSLPETYMHAAKPPTKLGGRPIRKRPYLAFFAGQMHGRVRPVLLQYWKDKDKDMKIYEKIPASIAKKTNYIRHMQMSKFCICPMGYEVNSPRIVEAIYYDCVPVIIADNFVLPFSEVLNWQAFSVSVAERDVPNLKQILKSIPNTKYTTMQANLKHVRQHFLWHYGLPVKYDIFHMILHSLWLSRLASVSVNIS